MSVSKFLSEDDRRFMAVYHDRDNTFLSCKVLVLAPSAGGNLHMGAIISGDHVVSGFGWEPWGPGGSIFCIHYRRIY